MSNMTNPTTVIQCHMDQTFGCLNTCHDQVSRILTPQNAGQ